MGQLYNKNSIESLSPLEFTRLRPGVYCGSTEYASQLLIELFTNAVDEYAAGRGNKIIVKTNKNNVIIEDNAQGFICNEFREDGKSILEAAFSVLNTSGKFHDDGSYDGNVAGLNGIGSKLATFLSHNLKVTSYNNGKYETCYFVEGIFNKRETGSSNHHSGTVVEYNSSEEFFINNDIEINKIKNLFETTACLYPGLEIEIDYNGEKNNYISKNGLNDLANKDIKDKEIIKNRLNINYDNDKYKLNLIMSFTSEYSAKIIPYVNGGLTERGVHLTKLKTIITRELNNFYKEKGWLKDTDNNLSGDEAQEGMYLLFNLRAPGAAYDAQTKSNVVKLDLGPIAEEFTTELQNWLRNNSKDIKIIADKAILARVAAEKARKARDAVREAGINKEHKKAIDLPNKLADCWSKNRKECEIFIVEGDSASGGMKTAADKEFQAIMPLRGKILNTQKATIDKIVKNAEIMEMIQAFGLELTEYNRLIFNERKLRYGKIIMSADGDVDGSHIQSLFYTFIFNFCPELISKGYIYATIPPLYKITYNKDEYKYLLDDKALEEYRQQNVGKKYIVNRAKGLGEMDAEELQETLLSKETRTLKQITLDNMAEAAQLFNDLMGDDSVPRKEFIVNHSSEATVEI